MTLYYPELDEQKDDGLDATLKRIEMERRAITLRLARLDEIEAGVRRAFSSGPTSSRKIAGETE